MVWMSCLRVSVVVASLGVLGGCWVVDRAAVKADNAVANSGPDTGVRIERVWEHAAAACLMHPPESMTLANPTCVSLAVRGRELKCMAPRVRQEGMRNHHASPDGLLAWERCVTDVAQVLVDGYYLGAREVERRLQACENVLEMAPTRAKPGFFSRLATLGDDPVAARPSPAAVGVGGRSLVAGLAKCEVLLPPKPLPVEVQPITPQEAPKEAVVEDKVEAKPATETPPAEEKKAVTKPAKKKAKQRKKAAPASPDVKDKKPAAKAAPAARDDPLPAKPKGKQT